MPTEDTFTCATCDHDIVGPPVFHLGLSFCCPGCAADGPCMCSYDTAELGRSAVERVVSEEDLLVEPVGGRVFVEPAVEQPAVTAATVTDDARRLVGTRR